MLDKSTRTSTTTPRWQRTLYIIFFAQMMTAVGFSSIFPFLPLYVNSLDSTTNLGTEVLAGLVYSAHALCMMIASPIWGALADRFGRKLMVQRASLGSAGIIFLMAFVRSAEQLVLLRAIQGSISGVVAAMSSLVAAEVPRSRTGYAMGLLQVGLGSGVAIGPLLGGAVADALGYRAAFFVTSSLLFLAGMLVRFGVEENFLPSESKSGARQGFIKDWRKILTSPGVKPSLALRFISQLGRMVIIPIVPLFIQSLLTDPTNINTVTGLVIGVTSATMTISAIYLGRLGDRVGHQRVLIAGAFAAALFYLPQTFVKTTSLLLVLQAFVGVAMGGILPSVSALLAKLTDPGEEGTIYGLDNSIRAGARSVAPLLGAAIATLFGLRATFSATAVLYLLTALFAGLFLPKPTQFVEPITKEKHQTRL
ncbi:MAG: MFS transporter [Anaerolineales bacterium]|nr:MFS transporter [Anaerolineales bacterium]